MIRGVILVGVGRNLNRAVRTCYSFGVYDVYCLRCAGRLEGNLFSAAGRVRVHRLDTLDAFDRASILALEATESLPDLRTCPTSGVEYLSVGGEAVTLRRRDFPHMARIPTPNGLCLTTEAALAIALYELVGREARG